MNYLFWILVGIIIGWIIEWVIDWLFWRKPGGQALEKLTAAETENRRLQAQLAEKEQKLAQLEAENGRLQAAGATGLGLAGPETRTRQAHLSDLEATQVRSQPVPKDRLEEIDGIGPAYAKRLNEAGIYSFAQLAQQTPARLQEIIKPEEWQKIEPERWIAQAQAMGDPDQLEDIDGIGEVYAQRLNKAGIYTFAQLAEVSPERVREIINPEEWQKIEPESWIAEAKELAAQNSGRAATGA